MYYQGNKIRGRLIGFLHIESWWADLGKKALFLVQ